jgi:copper/silver efflux system protein
VIQRIIEWSLRNRFIVICGALLLIALGINAVFRTPVDAIPDLSENQVLVYADWMGRSPQEVEDQVTYPLSTGLQGLAGVKDVRAVSMFGFSLLTIIFEDDVDLYFARTRVLERLNYLEGSMPEGVKPQLGPDATNTISTLIRRRRRTAVTTLAGSARCRTGTFATNLRASRVSRKSRASAAS